MTPDPHEPESPSPHPGEPIPANPSPQSQSQAPTPSGPSGLGFPALGAGTMQAKDEKTWGMLGHLLNLSGIFTSGVGYVVGPLVVYLLKKDNSPYVGEHARESLNFGILTFIVVSVTGLIGIAACITWLITAVMVVLNLIWVIQATIKANDGQPFRYALNWRLIR